MASSSSAAAESEDTPGSFSKPGQRFATPAPAAGGRVFYESLYKENPNSAMALIYCIEYGVLSVDEATRQMGRYQRLKAGKKDAKAVAPTPEKAGAGAGAGAGAKKGGSKAGAGKVFDETGGDAGGMGVETAGGIGMGL